MKRTNYYLQIKENNQYYYFHYDGIITTGDIVRIGPYRVCVIKVEYSCPYTELVTVLVNEGEIRITDLR